MKIIYRYLLLSFFISIAAGCASVSPDVKKEPAPSEEIAVPAPQPEPIKEPEAPVKWEPVKPAVPVKPKPPVKTKEPPAKVEEPPVKAEEPPAKVEETPAKPEPVIEKKEPVVEAKPEPVEEKNTVIAEFEGVTITKETYDQTKTEMEKIVEKLNRITATKDYAQWTTFLSEEYKQQYSQPLTLRKVSEALPVKGIKLKSLRDYFMYVFVPSRQNVRVDDIKFVSPTRVDVIMKQANVSLLVYGLENINGSWKLIPPKL
ncbi:MULTISPECIES: hypothetical protein [unclassified Treponema]|uniref:hypothetical protein n=1 Tax=unclassified Treponema TaxID=2638727 RepID=UPI0005301219|nr:MULTISPECIES: hypothetical protein [unclassified Treponema]AIW90545.1 lipoprotein [Treponema sp. OMZ 838]UTC51631.1 hypothetical protein E4N65_04705 [Treponema sp. OMZ 855]